MSPLTMFGTRPEVTKLVLVVLALSTASNVERVLDVTMQECEMRRLKNFAGGLDRGYVLTRLADRGAMKIVDLVRPDPEAGTMQAALGEAAAADFAPHLAAANLAIPLGRRPRAAAWKG